MIPVERASVLWGRHPPLLTSRAARDGRPTIIVISVYP
jgi:hypothetical protein